MQKIELGSLTHGSHFRFSPSGVPWKVVRHVEDYTVAEMFGGQEFPRHELVWSEVEVFVSEALPWLDARDYGAYSIDPSWEWEHGTPRGD